MLGILKEDCIVLDFEVRRFPEFRQKILDKMLDLGRSYNPDIVLLPSVNDTHQDHRTIATEGFRAFKRTTMLGYEVPWNNLEFRTNCFVGLTERELELKIEALDKYESQKHRNYASADFVRSLAITRGVQIGKKYAESFEVIRWVLD